MNPDWSTAFAGGAEVKQYVDHCADKYGIRPQVRLRSEVSERAWDAAAQLWRLRVNGSEVTARFVVSAIGAFVDPKPVEIPGVGDFEGKTIHSARWDHDCDLAGKRVAIVGTGASAVQIVPKLARIANRLDVYQRTPIWVGPRYNPRTPPRLKSLYRRFPAIQNLVRIASSTVSDVALTTIIIHHRRMPFAAKGVAAWLRHVWYRAQVPDRELRRKLTPSYGFACKRPSVSNSYLRSFTRENVELITDPIERVTGSGLLTASGEHREVDVLVLATGFRLASDPENFRRTPVLGRDGFDLGTCLAEERVACFEGTTMPGLPNHFMVFGPYGFVGGSWFTLVETTAAHVVRVICEARRRGAVEVEVSQEATDRWTADMRERMGRSLWNNNNCATANSYYFDQHGDASYLRPTSAGQARRASRNFALDDYGFAAPLDRAGAASANGARSASGVPK